VLDTEARWRELPQKYPPFQTCHRRFQHWVRAGKRELVLQMLAEELQARGRLDLEEAFIDATLAGTKKGVPQSGFPDAARERKSSFSPMITVFLSQSVSKALRRTKASSSKALSDTASSMPFPARIIDDRAYDSDRLDRDLAERYGIEMIAPHRGVRRKPTQDDRSLRRYCRRWRVDRLFAWLHHFRRLVIHWE
jgi:transposase